jgi:hypothetical protein
MKKLVVLISIMIICFFTLFLMRDSFAASSTKPKAPLTPAGTANPQTAPATSQKPNIPGGIKTFRSAQITNLEIGTDATGTWFWKATVKNTGTATLNGPDLTVQGMCISFPPAQHTWQAASGSIVGAGTLAPNQTVDVKNFWTRCCLTTELKVELRDKISNKLWDTKSVSNLIYSTAPMKPLNIRVKRIEWDDSVKGWKATIKNNTNYTVKISVQGDFYSPNVTPVKILPAGGQQLTLGPQAEAVTMQLHAATAKHGDVLRVHIGLIMGSGTCNETWENCGGTPSNNITIPNSANF